MSVKHWERLSFEVYTLFNENFRRFDDTAHTARSDNVIAGHKAVAAADSRVHYFSSVNDFPKDNPLTTTDGTHYDAAGLKRISEAILAKELASSKRTKEIEMTNKNIKIPLLIRRFLFTLLVMTTTSALLARDNVQRDPTLFSYWQMILAAERGSIWPKRRFSPRTLISSPRMA